MPTKNFLLILDGLDSVLADPHENELLKMLLEKLLEGAPALTIICTAVAPLGVPYENIVGLSRLVHASYTPLARLLHASCTPLARLLHASFTRILWGLADWYSITCFTGTKVRILTQMALLGRL